MQKISNFYINFPQKKLEDETNGVQGAGMKTINPSFIFDFWKRLEVLLGLKLIGYTDTLTQASNILDEIYEKGEIQNKQQNRNAFDKWKIF